MKLLIREIRLLIAEWLLWKAYSIAPKCDEGDEIKAIVVNYTISKVSERLKPE